jgi:hypothetical protein
LVQERILQLHDWRPEDKKGTKERLERIFRANAIHATRDIQS